MKKVVVLFLSLVFSFFLAKAGEPITQNYSAKNYNAHPIIWHTIQDSKGQLWMANNDGVLRFNGSNWVLYKTPKPARYITFDKHGALYVACEGDIGVFEANNMGVVTYKSLKTSIGKDKLVSKGDKQVFAVDGEIYFTCGNYVLSLKNEDKKVSISSYEVGEISGAFVSNNKLYVNIVSKGLGVFNTSKWVALKNGALLKATSIIGYTTFNGNQIIGTNYSGLFQLTKKGTLIKYYSNFNAFALKGLAALTSSTNGDIVLGTFNDGVAVYSKTNKLRHVLNLPSTETYSLFFDAEQNLWAGHRKGLSQVKLGLPIQYFSEFNFSGSITDLKVINDKLYIATTNGLFITNKDKASIENLKKIADGEMWALSSQYVASTNGLLSFSGNNLIPDEPFLSLQYGNKNKDYLYAFSPDACYVSKGDKQFNKLEGINVLANSIYENGDGSYWVGTQNDGLLKIPSTTTKTTLPDELTEAEVIIRVKNGSPIFQTKRGVYAYVGGVFTKDEKLTLQFTNARNKQLFFENDFWVFRNQSLKNYKDDVYTLQSIAYAISGRPTALYKDGDNLWVGFEEKLYLIHLKQVTDNYTPKSIISRIINDDGKIIYDGLATTQQSTIEIGNDNRSIQIEFGVNSLLNPAKNLYRYRIKKISSKWSSWKKEAKISLNGVMPGSYTIEVETRTASGKLGAPATLGFKILAPWYLSIYAYIAYAVLFFGLIYLLIRLNNKVLISKNNKLEQLVKERTIALEENNTALSLEKEKSDTLLLNILPEEIAEELKAKGESEAKLHENVTVFFTDFVNFTGISEKMNPTELVREIHKNFSEFDKIMEANGLEKIKTIGDAYLAVCGLPYQRDDHAKRAIKAAKDIISFMEKSDSKFQIRIGLHSGPVVAGIVGLKKYAYDIWGDTVNTAARMEQNSEGGKINISLVTYTLAQNNFKFHHRGKLPVKNKGEMDMYFVE